MPQNEQEKPFAPGNSQTIPTATHPHSLSIESKHHRPRHRSFIICGCAAALLLIVVVVILVLSLTLFHIKDPVVSLNAAQIQGLQFIDGTVNGPQPRSTNLTVLADVSIKNPNEATFRFSDVTTDLYYDDVLVGQARTPPGHAGARRTLRMNVTIDVMVEKILGVRRLGNDLAAGALAVSSYSVISGRVKVLIVKKDIVVWLNCTMSVNVRSRVVEDPKCKSRVSHK